MQSIIKGGYYERVGRTYNNGYCCHCIGLVFGDNIMSTLKRYVIRKIIDFQRELEEAQNENDEKKIRSTKLTIDKYKKLLEKMTKWEMKPVEVIMKLTPEEFADENNQIVFHAEEVRELVRCHECIYWNKNGHISAYGSAECSKNPNSCWYGDSFRSWGGRTK